jgi:hypothetical protein
MGYVVVVVVLLVRVLGFFIFRLLGLDHTRLTLLSYHGYCVDSWKSN